jgi:hypothetical protein
MIISYLRSSSFSCHSMCEQQYFLAYNLCIQQPDQFKSMKGSITHKALECIAWHKKCLQDGVLGWNDDNFGPMTIDQCDPDCLIEMSFEYYKNNGNTFKWNPADLRDCREWMWSVLNCQNGHYHPMNRKIVAPEQPFDFVIEKDWAKYDYVLPDGTKLKGQLALKGTMDLVTEIKDGIIEIVDYKTGERIDWANGDIKTYDKLCNDSQLRIYSYAAWKLFPDVKDIIITIFFTRDGKKYVNGKPPEKIVGGPFTISLGKDDLEKTESIIRKKFETIRECTEPYLTPHPSWSGLPSKGQKILPCTKFCYYGKTMWKDTDKNICQFIHEETKKKGIDQVIKEHANLDRISKYGNAAGRTSEERERGIKDE